jgi:hypothetical protein
MHKANRIGILLVALTCCDYFRCIALLLPRRFDGIKPIKLSYQDEPVTDTPNTKELEQNSLRNFESNGQESSIAAFVEEIISLRGSPELVDRYLGENCL